ncbi:MAG: hypothetical protein ABJL55_21335 [Roseibium sp.]
MFFSRNSRTCLGLSTAASLLVLQASPALAFDPTGDPVADAFLTLLDSEEGTVESYGTVDSSGGIVSINDIVITNDDADDAKVTISTTVLTDGVVEENGRLKLASLKLENLALAADDGGMTLQTMKVTDLLLPAAAELKDDAASVGPGYKSLEIMNVAISDEEGQVAEIEKIQSAIDGMDGDLPTSGHFSISGAKVNVKEIEAEEAKTLSALGYETLTVNVSGSGKWDPEAATLMVPDLKIDGTDVAALSLSLSLGGITRDVVNQLDASQDNPEEALALLQGMTVSNIKIRLDDASLTGRVLDQEAKNAGVDVPQYIAGLTGSLPLMLGMLQNKELETKVTEAITQYLNEPGSLEITATPGAPVPMAQIMGTAMIAPQMIPQILSLGITANE